MEELEDLSYREIQTTIEEKNRRKSFCDGCDSVVYHDDVATCKECACPIEFIISFDFKTCPIGKWE